jgi:tripeptide aminopeptidase
MESDIIESVLNLAVDIQQIPAPTFAESRRAEFVFNCFIENGLQETSLDAVGNVYARLPGKGDAAPLIVSAHLDTVFPITTDLAVRRSADKIAGPGIGDNSLGVAGLFGLLWSLRQRGTLLPGDLWLVANVGEEGLGDLGGMRAVVERFGEEALAYVILEGMALGQVYNRGLGVRRYRVAFRTQGGHSWVDYGRPSAIHEMAAFVYRLTSLQLPQKPRTTLNVGMISGGTSINTIAAAAFFELDLRSKDQTTLDQLSAQVEKMAAEATRADVKVSTEVIGCRPPGQIAANAPLVRLACDSLEEQGIQPRLHTGSTDANIPLSRGLPAVCLGLTHGYGAHTQSEFIYTRPLAQGLAQLVSLVEGIYTNLNKFRRLGRHSSG